MLKFIDILREIIEVKKRIKYKFSLLILGLRDYNFERFKKLLKGERRMPRLLWAKKDVVSCEKLRGFANEI